MEGVFPDLNRTKVLLFGTQKYNDKDFCPVDPAMFNISQLALLLKDPNILGVSPRNIKQMINEPIDNLINELNRYRRDPNIETFIFYYIGHGQTVYHKGKTHWFLTAIDSINDVNDFNTVNKKSLEFDDLKEYIENIGSYRVVILDACYSGHATQGNTKINYNIEGTYIITSSSYDEESFFDTNSSYSYFTAELINILKNGINYNTEYISVKQMYDTLFNNIHKKSNVPLPHQKNNFSFDFYLVKNLNFKHTPETNIKDSKLKNETQIERSKIDILPENRIAEEATKKEKIIQENRKLSSFSLKNIFTKNKSIIGITYFIIISAISIISSYFFIDYFLNYFISSQFLKKILLITGIPISYILIYKAIILSDEYSSLPHLIMSILSLTLSFLGYYYFDQNFFYIFFLSFVFCSTIILVVLSQKFRFYFYLVSSAAICLFTCFKFWNEYLRLNPIIKGTVCAVFFLIGTGPYNKLIVEIDNIKRPIDYEIQSLTLKVFIFCGILYYIFNSLVWCLFAFLILNGILLYLKIEDEINY